MLKITILGDEYFDNVKQEFLTIGDVTIELEHSLVSLSKWESVFQKPFLSVEDKTTEETVGYIRAMLLDPDIPSEVLARLTDKNVREINEYIDNKMSATWFSEAPGAPKSREIITSELIYYWLVSFNIPFECETWHLNRLFTLIRVCNLKNAKPQKMSPSEMRQRQRSLNEQRKAELKSKG